MTGNEDWARPDQAWRDRMTAWVYGQDHGRAAEALLSLTYHAPDRRWLEARLLEVIDSNLDIQVRQLAVTCLGHAARIHGATSDAVSLKLQELRKNPQVAGLAEDALSDIGTYAPHSPPKSSETNVGRQSR